MVASLSIDGCFDKGSPFIITGPCALQDEETTRNIAEKLVLVREKLDILLIFKGSCVKSNRTRHDAFHGIGFEKGLELLALVRDEYGLPVTTDVHESIDVDAVSEVVDLIQIPSLLCKQTKLLFAASDSGKPVNIKKGQFMPVLDMAHTLEKITSRGNEKVMLTERGSVYGGGDTVNDFRSIVTMKSFGYPIVFDATHSIRILSERSDSPDGGMKEFIEPLVLASAAIGSDGLFLETHVEPEKAATDAAACINIDALEKMARIFKEVQVFARSILQEESSIDKSVGT